MKMKDKVKEPRIWKDAYLNLDVKVAEQRSEYFKIQYISGRKDTYKIYEEAKRLFK